MSKKQRLLNLVSQKNAGQNFACDILPLIPEMEKCVMFWGGPHHNETVFTHLVNACFNIEPEYAMLRIAALFHDIGKPLVFKDGKFLGHAEKSAEIAGYRLEQMGFATNEIIFATTLVSVHMKKIEEMKPSKAGRFTDYLRAKGASLEDYARMRIADCKANSRKKYAAGDIAAMENRIFGSAEKNNDMKSLCVSRKLSVNGNDIMDALHEKPGPLIGKILDHLHESVSNGYPDVREILLSEAKFFHQNLQKF